MSPTDALWILPLVAGVVLALILSSPLPALLLGFALVVVSS
jgi:hypothetical protein